MIERSLRTCLAALALMPAPPGILHSGRPGTEPSKEPIITEAMRKEDPRLTTNITLDVKQTTVGELLDRIRSETGVAVTADERDGASDVSVAVFCKDTPVYKILNGVWSVMSYRGAYWAWERAGKEGQYRYRLFMPLAARGLRDRLRNWVQERFEANAEKLMAAVDGSPEQKRNVLRDIYGTDDIARNHGLTPESLWMNVRIFKEMLTPDQRLQVMRNGAEFSVPFRALSERSKNDLLQARRDYYKRLDDLIRARMQKGPLPHPYVPKDLATEPDLDKVGFCCWKYGSTPAVMVWINDVPAPLIFGGMELEDPYRAYLHALWLLETDAKDDPASSRIITRPAGDGGDPTKPADPRTNSVPMDRVLPELERRLEEVALGSGVPLIARLPEENVISLEEPRGRSLGDYWKDLWNRPIMLKWRDGVQLFSTEGWPREDPPIPLRIVRALRRDAKPNTLLPLEDLAAAADAMTQKQLLRLKPEFPVMKSVADVQGVLAFLHRYPALAKQALTKQGLPLTPQAVEALRPLAPPMMVEALDRGDAAVLTVTIIDNNDPQAPSRQVMFLLRNKEGKILRGVGFNQQPQPPAKTGV